MKAVNYYIIVDKIKEEPRSASGFVLSENQNQDIRYSKGKVVGVGENVNTIKQDDIVWYDKHAGHGIEFNGNYYCVIKYTDVVIIN